MRYIVNPKQKQLFDPFKDILSKSAYNRLLNSWAGTFRHVILELMPAEEIGKYYEPVIGRPAKELYSMAALILIKEFRDWTNEEAVDAYCYHNEIHYALNLEPANQELGVRTLERYIKRFEQDSLASTTLETVTSKLVEHLDLDITTQRLDSTHVLSNMASFGRTRLMGVTVKRFLTQLKRHDLVAYESLAPEFRERYTPGANSMFSDVEKDGYRKLRQDVAEDMHFLISRFSDSQHSSRSTFQNLITVFYQQCDVAEDKVIVKAMTGSKVIQNPSDLDATYDGHKGSGYQVQLSETCGSENQLQLITHARVETACESDSKALEPVLDALEEKGILPEVMLADTLYCNDENVQSAQQQGVELVGPSVNNGSTPQEDSCEKLSIDDFDIDEQTELVVCCPAGHEPKSSTHNKKSGTTITVMAESACGRCEFCDQCPVKKHRQNYRLRHTATQRRNAGRRREEQTDAFRERYKIRAGIEATNSGLKRTTGMSRLRVRGMPAVCRAIYLKVAGWNILRASRCAKIRQIVMKKALCGLFLLTMLISRLLKAAKTAICLRYAQFSPSFKLPAFSAPDF
jgi:hypothetical protein